MSLVYIILKCDNFYHLFIILIYSHGELNENPDAVLLALKFFMRTQNKSPTTLPFKALASNEDKDNDSDSMGKF